MQTMPRQAELRTVTTRIRALAETAAAKIPDPPNLHERVRAAAKAAGQTVVRPVVLGPQSLRAGQAGSAHIPPTPNLHDRVRAAAAARAGR